MNPKHNMHRTRDSYPLGYFITMRTYGTWLPGDTRGTIDDRHNQWNTPRLPADPGRQSMAFAHLRDEPFLLDGESAALVERTITEVCQRRNWRLHTVCARTNHVHVVVSAQLPPERVMNDFKAWGTRSLRENGFAQPAQNVWVEHGSTPYLWTEAQLAGAVDYVKNWQGGPLQRAWDDVRQDIEDRERLSPKQRTESRLAPVVDPGTLANATGSASTLANAKGSVHDLANATGSVGAP